MKRLVTLLATLTTLSGGAQIDKLIKIPSSSLKKIKVKNENTTSAKLAKDVTISSTTYWVPLLEWAYEYDTTANVWNMTDSTRFFYYSTPPVLNGLTKYTLFYDIQNSQTYKDTFQYNSNGQITLEKSIELGTPTNTVWTVKSYRYNTSNLIQGNTQYNHNWDFANCMGGGMGYKLIFSNRDTVIYNSSNYHIIKSSYTYDNTNCMWKISVTDTIQRNATNLPKVYTYYYMDNSSSPPQWMPSYRESYVHNSNDDLITVYLFGYNSSTNKWDTTGKIDQLVFFYYNKYDLFSSFAKEARFHLYDQSTGTFSVTGKFVYTNDSYGNITGYYSLSWNGTSYDTAFAYKALYYYTPSSGGKIDSIIEKQKSGSTAPYVNTYKYIYPSSIQVTGIYDNINMNAFSFMLYPVPCHDKLNIVSNNNQVIKNIQIIDLQGRVMLNKDAMSKNSIIDISYLQSGIYLLQLKTINNEEYKTKFVKE